MLLAATICFAALAGMTSVADAHHSFAMFDQTKQSTKTKTVVTEFRYTNPHSFVLVKARDEKGAMQIFTLECNSVNMLSRLGWKPSILKAGDVVDITFYPLRNGKPGGMLKTIKTPDGKTLNAW
ncbi:DUF6152 family protein [Sphingobium cloacae]|uniref:Uncharacterized protein n=1 Tax=Sphingobium cloacae TaxID=120107 RepID=A0A1E1EYM2_9SPHN|nr:DUF6152 family protein [Sphingobium cloacae]BAV63358.1 hypothetical protein SCLO_1003180 [Sphingobium cloacae]